MCWCGTYRIMHDEVSDTENIRKNLAIERMIVEGCDILLDTSQTFIRQGESSRSTVSVCFSLATQAGILGLAWWLSVPPCSWPRPTWWLRATSVLFLPRGHETQQHSHSKAQVALRLDPPPQRA